MNSEHRVRNTAKETTGLANTQQSLANIMAWVRKAFVKKVKVSANTVVSSLVLKPA